MTTTTRAATAQHRRPVRYSDSDRWRAALDDCSADLIRKGLAPSTLTRVTKHLHRFAAHVATGPYEVTPNDVSAWLDAQECSPAALTAYRTSLRTFYRWAYRSGRVTLDPTGRPGPHPLARAVPREWEPVLSSFRRWLVAGGRTASTVAAWNAQLRQLARETGAPSPWDLTGDDLAQWVAGHHWSRETVRGHRSLLRTFYGWAYDVGHIDANPAQHLARVRASAPAPRPASEEAYRQALSHADARAALMLRLAAEYGLRRAEVACVHSRDLVQDNAGAWWLTVHGKGDKLRRVPLSRELSAAIRERGTGYTFPGGYHGHLSPAYVGKLTSALLPDGVTLHQLRHRFATRAYALDRDVFTLQRLLGHASPATTQRYVQTDDETLRAMIDAVGRFR